MNSRTRSRSVSLELAEPRSRRRRWYWPWARRTLSSARRDPEMRAASAVSSAEACAGRRVPLWPSRQSPRGPRTRDRGLLNHRAGECVSETHDSATTAIAIACTGPCVAWAAAASRRWRTPRIRAPATPSPQAPDYAPALAGAPAAARERSTRRGDAPPPGRRRRLRGRSSRRLRGHPVVVNIWASWCGPVPRSSSRFQQRRRRARQARSPSSASTPTTPTPPPRRSSTSSAPVPELHRSRTRRSTGRSRAAAASRRPPSTTPTASSSTSSRARTRPRQRSPPTSTSTPSSARTGACAGG